MARAATCAPPAQSGGLTDCNGACADLTSDNTHCGGCNVVCDGGASCVGGACRCANGQSRCGGVCANLAVDPRNCGACAVACALGRTCIGGHCQ